MPKILLDENIPKRLKYRLLEVEFNVFTVRDMDWLSIKNGKLLKLSVENDFDIFITTDKNLTYQQNISQIDLAFIILNVPNLKYEFIQPILPQIFTLITVAEKRQIYILQA